MKTKKIHRPDLTATVVALGIVLALALAATAPAFAATAAGVVNINDASARELALLPRVGPALAERIIAFRDENGRFEQTEDLILVRGIGDKTYDLMADYVVLEGKTTLTEKVRGVTTATSDDER